MAQPATRPARSNPNSGISMEMLVPGKFYQCVEPGHCSCSLTGIVIPGSRAILDGSTKRTIVGLTDLPDPVQLPHFKLVIELSESGKERKEIEKDFNAADETPVHEYFQLALATGQIRLVQDSEVEEFYPTAWANRKEKIVWESGDVNRAVPLRDLVADAQALGKLASISKNHDNLDAAKLEIKRRDEAAGKGIAVKPTPAPKAETTESAPPKPALPPRPPKP